MTLDTLFLMLATVQLALVAYGVVGARRRLAGGPKLVTQALLVLTLPVLLPALLLAAGEGALVRQWWRLFALTALAGAAVAVVAEQVARRTTP